MICICIYSVLYMNVRVPNFLTAPCGWRGMHLQQPSMTVVDAIVDDSNLTNH